ncbi:hypothetical protein M422DRAFT_45882 [Sphaerobolus stellatus SS14]|nr:hypothetical protein M422DRAFT_45882 [Sphaerobolus stellatus SS14]
MVVDQQEEHAVEVMVTPPSAKPSSTTTDTRHVDSYSPTAHRATKPSSNAQLLDKPAPNESQDLSMIAETDENDISRMPSPAKQAGPVIRDKEISFRIPIDPSNPDGPMDTVTVPYYEDDRSFFDSEPTSTTASFPLDPYARDYETHELPTVVPESEPAPQPPRSPPAAAPRKTGGPVQPVLPSLPGPSPPLRKSTRDGLPPTINLGQVAQAAKRTSWLQKARDVTAKRTSVVSGTKRKSGEMLLDDPTEEAWGRDTKIAKTSLEHGVSEALSGKGKQLEKPTIQPFKPISKPRDIYVPPVQINNLHGVVEDDTEEMVNLLKQRVDGLGARGKSFGKSFGGMIGAAAGAEVKAATEAKAAAEARLAQRDGARHGRLSVSDLIGSFETGSDVKKASDPKPMQPPPRPATPHQTSKEARESISTTPSDSPPAQFTVPIADPVPAPVRVVNTIPKFQVQRSALQHQPQPSYTWSSQGESHEFQASQSQPTQSTQETYVSALFDDADGVTSTRSSFGTEYTQTQTQTQTQEYDEDDEYAHDAPAMVSKANTGKTLSKKGYEREPETESRLEAYTFPPVAKGYGKEKAPVVVPDSYDLDDERYDDFEDIDVEDPMDDVMSINADSVVCVRIL